jgi:hypothetical protein
MFSCRYRAFPTPAEIKRHEKMKICVGVRSEGEGREAGLPYCDAQLFAKLADERLFGPLSGFDLASGKFP